MSKVTTEVSATVSKTHMMAADIEKIKKKLWRIETVN